MWVKIRTKVLSNMHHCEHTKIKNTNDIRVLSRLVRLNGVCRDMDVESKCYMDDSDSCLSTCIPAIHGGYVLEHVPRQTCQSAQYGLYILNLQPITFI